MPFLFMNALLWTGVGISMSLAFVRQPRLRVTSVLRLFVSAVTLAAIGTLVMIVIQWFMNDYYYSVYGNPLQFWQDVVQMSMVMLPVFSIFALTSISMGITIRTVRARFAANLREGKGFFDATGRTRNDAVLETTALVFAVVWMGLAGLYAFLCLMLVSGRLD